MRSDFDLQSVYSSWHGVTTTSKVILVLTLLVSVTNCGPTYRRTIREFDGTKAQHLNETQQPEGTCLLDGILVPQTTVYCEKKSGCRAIQKTGYCCPDYKCECEKDGKIYSNGEKLVDPENPCEVCYCQGGEIVCSSVTCYKRDDCEPKFIAGRCCPEYDNCPENSNKTRIDPTTAAATVTTKQSTTPLPQHAGVNSNPLGIKIKEITKPEEIRIVDDKPKPINPRPKPVDSSLTNQLKIHLSKDIHQSLYSGSQENSEDNDQLTATSTGTGEASTSSTILTVSTETKLDEDFSPSEETVKNVRQAEVVSKEKEEIVIVNDSNGQAQPIAVFGTQGLQRGDDPSDHSSSSPVPNSDEVYAHESNHKTVTVDFDPIASESDIYSYIYTSPENSTEFMADVSTSGPEVVSSSTSLSDLTTEGNIEASGSPPIEPFSIQVSHANLEEEDNLISETNPAYPVINEEDLSNYQREQEEYQESPWTKSSGHKEEPRSSQTMIISSKLKTSQPPAAPTTEVSKMDSTTEGALSSSTETEGIPMGRAPGEPCLIPYWERNSTNKCNSTESMFLLNETSSEEDEDKYDETVELDIESFSGSGSGMGEPIKKEREHTTPKYNTLAIEELGSGDDRKSPANDPKNDVESLKLGDDDSLSSSGNGSTDIKSYPGLSKVSK